jgi:hypothetical protein
MPTMPDLSGIYTEDTPASSPDPDMFRIIQDADQLEIRGYYGVLASAAYTTVARFLSNQETHLYGELHLGVPAIRHAGTLALNNVNAPEAIVTFCTGAGSTEVLRVEEDGTLTFPERTGYVTVHATAFFRSVIGTDTATSGLIVSGTTFDSASLTTSDTTNVQNFLAAFPARIPQGATVTSIGFGYKVGNGGGHWSDYVDVSFFKTRISDGYGYALQTIPSEDGTGSYATVDTALTTPETIDYETYTYGFAVNLKNGAATNSRFYNLKITYTYTTLGG